MSQLYETEDGDMRDLAAAAAATAAAAAAAAGGESASAPPGGFSPSYSEVLSLFPRPKELLSRVIQVATSSNTPKVSGARVSRGGMSAFVASFLLLLLSSI